MQPNTNNKNHKDGLHKTALFIINTYNYDHYWCIQSTTFEIKFWIEKVIISGYKIIRYHSYSNQAPLSFKIGLNNDQYGNIQSLVSIFQHMTLINHMTLTFTTNYTTVTKSVGDDFIRIFNPYFTCIEYETWIYFKSRFFRDGSFSSW